ncbi:MAG: hypothetical protein IT369_01545 [Candidatus Latescibacteria bacterium]|nr:hypothetical protein [Candidatus Latescibacterota bacterium]
MLIDELVVPKYHATLMGVLSEVAGHFRSSFSRAMLYGGSGQAFMVNIHPTLNSNSIYAWNHAPFFRALAGLGIEMIDHGTFSRGTSLPTRRALEQLLADELDTMQPCALVSGEYQLISGYDSTGLVISQPWTSHGGRRPRHLSFGTWSELGPEVQARFFTFRKVVGKDLRGLVIDSLQYARSLYYESGKHTFAPCAAGAEAYPLWARALQGPADTGHGNWWNATVWAECRAMASGYFAELAQLFPATAELGMMLADEYALIASDLSALADPEMLSRVPEKVALLQSVALRERNCVAALSDLVALLQHKA